MKADIHPNLTISNVICACGETFQTLSILNEIRAAVTKIGELSELSRKSLANAGNPDVRAADLAKVTAALQDPAYKKAIADYTAWVEDNCGDTSAKILSAATGG